MCACVYIVSMSISICVYIYIMLSSMLVQVVLSTLMTQLQLCSDTVLHSLYFWATAQGLDEPRHEYVDTVHVDF